MGDLFFVLVIVLVLAIIWRGPKTLPQIGSMLGRGFREAKNEASKVRSDEKRDDA
jgi:Sec-independent protein translocase protein TatA